MADYQVQCIKRDGADADRRIDGIGGVAGGKRWYLPVDEAIRWIEQGKGRFYVTAFGRWVWVIVKIHPTSGRKYLTTEGDGFPPNNLLNLPNCP